MVRITLAVLLLAILCQMKAVIAEDKPPPSRFIEEILVTADRREGTVQETSIAVTVVNTQMIEQFGIRNQEDIQNYIPSATVQAFDIAIRGVVEISDS